jgi:hypothetical protein
LPWCCPSIVRSGAAADDKPADVTRATAADAAVFDWIVALLVEATGEHFIGVRGVAVVVAVVGHGAFLFDGW